MAAAAPRLPRATLFPTTRGPGNGAGVPVEVNSASGVAFESSCFRGRFLLLHRPDPEPANGWRYADHFSTRRRLFELRIQGVFTEEPGDVFFAGELMEAVGLSWALRTSVSWLMMVVNALVAARGGWIYFNPEKETLADGDVERPHVVWRLNLADTVIATPFGEAPPLLTQSFDDTLNASWAGLPLDTSHTFTFVFHTMYVNLSRWQICNMPLGWSRNMEDFLGEQQLHLCMYRLKPPAAGARHSGHTEAGKEYLWHMALSRPGDKGYEEAEAEAVQDPAAAGRGLAAASRLREAALRLCRPWCR